MVRYRALLMMLAAVTGCGETPGSATLAAIGSAELALIPEGGTTLESVQYVVTKGPDNYRRGNVDVTKSTEIRFQIGGLPAASDYSMSVLAKTTNGVSCTSSPKLFAVQVGEVTGLSMILECGDEEARGGNALVDVTVTTLDCPEIDGVTVLPSSVAVGATLMLQGNSTIEGAEFLWSAPQVGAGTFSSAASAQTSFTCGSEGHYTLSLALSKDGCPTDTEEVEIDCTPCEVSVCQPGTSCSYQFSEGQSCMVSCADSSSIASVSVTYADNCMPFDCSAAAPSCVGTDSCSVSVGNAICGTDPCPGIPKLSKVLLTCSVAGSGPGCEVAPCQPGTSCSYQFTEEQSCMVSCADNSSIASVSVTYADNCMPLDCPAAAPSCIGAESCSVSVSNAICGADPCPGTHKLSNVKLTCGPADSGGNAAP